MPELTRIFKAVDDGRIIEEDLRGAVVSPQPRLSMQERWEQLTLALEVQEDTTEGTEPDGTTGA